MKNFLLLLIVATTFFACVSTTTGWQYVGNEKINPEKEQKLFESDHRDCERKLKIARDAVKEYKMAADHRGAYEHCMLVHGWQQVIVD
ncbi:MAG: hypothetical protein ACOH5I_08420 [Oligoflexus sp.]